MVQEVLLLRYDILLHIIIVELLLLQLSCLIYDKAILSSTVRRVCFSYHALQSGGTLVPPSDSAVCMHIERYALLHLV